MTEAIIAAVGSLGFLLVLLLIVVAILWIILPFAIFGTKPKLDNISSTLVKINDNLCEIGRMLKPIAEQHGYSEESSTGDFEGDAPTGSLRAEMIRENRAHRQPDGDQDHFWLFTGIIIVAIVGLLAFLK